MHRGECSRPGVPEQLLGGFVRGRACAVGLRQSGQAARVTGNLC